jgi:putative ABC transport system permease protein
MWKNALLVALRNLRKHRGYALINVVGLSVGMACSLLIGLYVRDELSYDRFHDGAADLYRVNWDFDWNGQAGVGPGTPPPLAATFVREIPEVEAAVRLYPAPRVVGRNGEVFFGEAGIVAVDSNFFDLFEGFTLLEGDARTALAAPNSVVLTEETARRYFGDEHPVGQALTLGEDRLVFGRYAYASTFRVTGVVEGPPPNSHLQFDMLTSMGSHPEVAHFDWSWVWMQVTTYVRLRPGASVEAVEAKVPAILRRDAAGGFARVGLDYDELVESGGHFDFVLQPFLDVYLGSGDTGNRLGPAASRAYVVLFAVVAVFVLLIACVNFMNLATARSTTRAREVGVRKVLGSRRRALVGQFLVESLVLSALALPVALGLVAAFVGPFNALSGKALRLDLLDPAWLPAALVGLTVLVGFVAGSYPGLYLSSFRPIQALRGAFRPGGKSRRLRHGLVVFQFAMTIALIACTLVVQQQMDFIRQADLGFDQHGVVVVSNENDRLRGQAEAFKERLLRHPGIVAASVSTGVPPYDGFQDSYTAEGRGDEQFQLISYMTDEDFAETMGLQLVQGRGFSRDRAADAGGVILNEAAVAAFGWEDPVGRLVQYPGGNNAEYRVLGVMRDFNFVTLRSPVTPFALFYQASGSYETSDSYVVVRVAPEALERGLALLEAEWKAFAPDTPFEYTFLDEGIGEQYLAEQRLGRMFLVFSALTILIACMGLLGLAAFAAEQRTKEIGVRKVLGASVASVVALLSRDFLRLVGLGFLVAVPVAWLAMARWLEGYAYRVDLGPLVFALAGLVALVVALLTVSTQALRAASADPVKALRYE